MQEKRDIFFLLGQIQSKQEAMHTELKSLRTDISDYKKFKNYLLGAVAAVSAIFSYIHNPFKD